MENEIKTVLAEIRKYGKGKLTIEHVAIIRSDWSVETIREFRVHFEGCEIWAKELWKTCKSPVCKVAEYDSFSQFKNFVKE